MHGARLFELVNDNQLPFGTSHERHRLSALLMIVVWHLCFFRQDILCLAEEDGCGNREQNATNPCPD
jgi:hypothetical protein